MQVSIYTRRKNEAGRWRYKRVNLGPGRRPANQTGPRVGVSAAEIARLRSQGLSLRAIGRSLGVSEGTVRRIAAVAA